VHNSITMDTLFSGTWPAQWSSREAPEFHDEMDRCIAAGFKVLALCPSADAMGSSIAAIAIKEKKLGLFFTHQGTALFGGDVDRVALWRQLGFGYCLLAYNQRNAVGDGCFEKDNGHLTTYGKALVDAYNRYGMIVDVSHTGE